MVTKRKGTSGTKEKRQVKVGKLNLNKETVKDLGDAETRKVMGGAAREKCKTLDIVYSCATR